MLIFDTNILKQNVQTLIKNNSMTQEELGSILGMSQPNVSKALNLKDKKCFTIEQVYAISERFKVSIDWLLGRKTDISGYSPRSVSALLAKMLADKNAKFCDIKREESIYRPDWIDDEWGGHPDYKITNETVPYKAIYFPSYYDPRELAEDEEELQELCFEAEQCGNDTRYKALNEFLGKFLQILPIYHDGKLSDDVFQKILEEFLNAVPDR